ncbi:MAG: hypothetical protein J1G07_01585 [Clostridiales bacterium]|nr:hypothetical protein [Clostridiales bacterium]
MKIKKFFLSLVSIVCVFAIAFGFTACRDDASNSSPLAAPVLLISDSGFLSWAKVENADSYEIYENGISIIIQSENYYEITQTEPGTYVYKVRALSSNKAYSTSSFSNERSYTVYGDKIELQAPVITISEEAVISWEPIDHADGYEIYEDSNLIDTVDSNSYLINSIPGLHVYTVKAISSDPAYSTSKSSAPCVFNVPLRVTIGILFPADYPQEEVTVGLYNGETKVIDKRINATPNDYATVMLLAQDGTYTVKVTDLAADYITGKISVSATNNVGVITIVKEDNVFVLGENTVTIAETYSSVQKAFIATDAGRFTISVDGSKKMSIEINNRTIIDSSKNSEGVFTAKEGELVLINVVASGSDTGEFTFTITEGGEVSGEKQYIKVGRGYGDVENVIEDSGTLYFNVVEPATFTFQFPIMNMFGVTVTFTINGVNYVFDDSTSFINDITFDEGEDIEIEVTVSTPGSYILFVFYSLES